MTYTLYLIIAIVEFIQADVPTQLAMLRPTWQG